MKDWDLFKEWVIPGEGANWWEFENMNPTGEI